MITTVKPTIHLIEQIESFGGYWAHWTCEIEDAEGNIREGSIQSDGHMHAWDTLEYED